MASTQDTTQTMEVITKILFRSAMQGRWDEVVSIYEEQEEAHTAKIIKSGDTALHVAVSDNQAGIVEKLLFFIKIKDKVKEALEIQNERGNTSLHLAASMGSVKMCRCIADAHPDLIGARNHDSETPLFLAALHGKKDAFLCLNSICGIEKGNTYCRRNDGDTILHCAISGEYYDLAFQIIHLYNNLVNSVNEEGLSPLHLLATKHSSFRSGSHFRWFTNIIYHCIFVEELEVETFKDEEDIEEDTEEDIVNKFDEEKNPPYPENYQTCINFLRLPLSALKILSNTGKGPRRTGGQAAAEDPSGNQSNIKAKRLKSQRHQPFPPNYHTCFEIIKLVSKAMLTILGLGFKNVKKVQEKKENNVWAAQILDELLRHTSFYEYENRLHLPYRICHYDEEESTEGTKGAPTDGSSPEAKQKRDHSGQNKPSEMERKETPILVAAKNGVVEMVERILELFPVAIHDMDSEKKNIVLLAVQYRQPHVYELLLKKKSLKAAVFQHVDIHGNSALHLVAECGFSGAHPFPAVLIQWEIKWYKYVKNSVPKHHFIRYNKEGKTAKEIFTKSHQELARKAADWLYCVSNSFSVVATLVTTVSFATTATIPGGMKENSSKPTFERHPGFLVYAISSLIALAFSVTSVLTFLALMTARGKIKDFDRRLPRNLMLGLTCLFISIGAMLVCFCAAHFFLLKDVLEHTAFPVYALACLPVTIFVLVQFPLYFVLVWNAFQTVPHHIIS